MKGKKYSSIVKALAVLCAFMLVVMGGCLQTCMIKARIAPRFGAPAMLHTFAPRLAAAALAALRCSVLMCGRSENVRKTGYASISVFAAAFLTALIMIAVQPLPAEAALTVSSCIGESSGESGEGNSGETSSAAGKVIREETSGDSGEVISGETSSEAGEVISGETSGDSGEGSRGKTSSAAGEVISGETRGDSGEESSGETSSAAGEVIREDTSRESSEGSSGETSSAAGEVIRGETSEEIGEGNSGETNGETSEETNREKEKEEERKRQGEEEKEPENRPGTGGEQERKEPESRSGAWGEQERKEPENRSGADGQKEKKERGDSQESKEQKKTGQDDPALSAEKKTARQGQKSSEKSIEDGAALQNEAAETADEEKPDSAPEETAGEDDTHTGMGAEQTNGNIQSGGTDQIMDQDGPVVECVDVRKFSNKEYRNRYRVTDEGSGVEKVYALISEQESGAVFSPDGGWQEIPLPENGSIGNSVEFEVGIGLPSKGYVYIHAVDRMGNKTDIAVKSHIAVYEDCAPTVNISCSGPEMPSKNKEFRVTAEDDGEVFSGIKSVSVTLTDLKGNRLAGAVSLSQEPPDGCSFSSDSLYRTKDAPESLSLLRDYQTLGGLFTIDGSDLKLDGAYTLTVSAMDYCGNISWEESVPLLFDNTRPAVKVSLDNKKEHTDEETGTEYYNAAEGKGLTVTFTDTCLAFRDSSGKSGEYRAGLCDADGNEIVSKELHDLENGETSADIIFTREDIKKCRDGKITVRVNSTDYAGNDNHMEDAGHFVLDTINPVAVINIECYRQPSRPDLNIRYGRRFYFNQRHTCEIRILEKNLKLDRTGGAEVRTCRLKVSYAEKKPDDQDYTDSSTVQMNAGDYKAGQVSFDEDQGTAVFTSAPGPGVIRYLVKGQDLAGNDLIYGKRQEKYFESEGLTYPIVTDLEIPQMYVKIETLPEKAPEGNAAVRAFEMWDDGRITANDRYRAENSASVTAALVNEDREKTPYKLYYDLVKRTEVKENTTAHATDYALGTRLVQAVTAPSVQGGSGVLKKRSCVIRVEGFYVEDLAGNHAGCTDGNRLQTLDVFLDPDAPGVTAGDAQAPMITIAPTRPCRKYGKEGAPIYNGESDLSIEVTVKDPYGPANSAGTAGEKKSRGSTGLKSVEYVLKNHEKTIFSRSFHYDAEAAKNDDSKLVFEKKWTGKEAVRIDKKKANYNSLTFQVNALDHAGNRSTAAYQFGIDITPPAVTLTYDNNHDRNGFYFNRSRTAVIAVKERNFNPDEFDVKVTGKAYGSRTKGAGIFIESSWDLKPGESDNGDDDTYIRKISFYNDGVYTLSLGTFGENNVIADHAGNKGRLKFKGQKAPFQFVIDRTKPHVSIRMDVNSGKKSGVRQNVSSPEEDGSFYYRADNCGITVTFDDNGHEFGMKGSGIEYSVKIDGRRRKALELDSFSLDRILAGKSKYRREQTLTYSAGELARDKSRLGDGLHTITVTAVDAAGNRADQDYFMKHSRGCRFHKEGYSGEFVLDTKRPLVTGIVTTSMENLQGQTYPVTDGRIYSDTDCVYYNRNIKVRISVKDENIRAGLFEGSMFREGDGRIPSVKAEISGSGKVIAADYILTGDHQYSGLTLTGGDKAGNPLLLEDQAGNKETSLRQRADDADRLLQSSADSGKGKVSLKYGKIVDRTCPQATILYDSVDYANMYKEDGDREKVRAYYRKPVYVRISFSDNLPLDGSRFYAGDWGADKALGFSGSSRTYDLPAISITRDSRRRFTAYGTDRALNPTDVYEMIPYTDQKHGQRFSRDTGHNKWTYVKKKAGAFNRDLTEQEAYLPRYQIIVDRTAPTFTLGIQSDESARQALQDGRYYFNRAYTAAFKIKETNFDASRIEIRVGSMTDNKSHYNTQALVLHASDLRSVIPVRDRTITDRRDRDGVYRYMIYGSDKAGNAILPSKEDNLDGTAGGTERRADNWVDGLEDERERGSVEREANMSAHIALDTVAPAGSLKVTTGSKDIYALDVNGNVTFAEPYRRETNADVSIKVFEEVERSPVTVSYRIDSTSSSGTKTVGGQPYQYNNSVSTTQKGQQAFRVNQYTFTDLAGNSRTYTTENRIYLDREAPAVDEIAPSISIAARAKPGTSAYLDGQPLFKSDVSLSIHISDPDPGKSSSGLADISYTLTDSGSPSGSGSLHQKNLQHLSKNYKDQALDYSGSYTVNVDGQKHNNNRIKIVVTAFDNAGNKREAEYHFGIDTTKPSVRITYDNNSAQNGEYFKAGRTAAVRVTERNFEPSRFHIATESGASIGGWSHSGGGGNGDGDQWIAKVTYGKDGNYTLRVSGEDMLGNRASEIRYEGTAPQKFTIDQTAPGVTVTYDNNDAANNRYYKAARRASVRVDDVNFAGQNDIRVEAAGGGTAPPVSFRGGTADLCFSQDGRYVFNGTVTDLAGNATAIPVQEEFVIDTRPPVLRFEDGDPFRVVKAADDTKSDRPVKNQFFTGRQFAPALTVMDRNCSTAAADAVFRIDGTKEGNHFTGRIGELEKDGTQFSVSLSPADFSAEKSRDDVYHVTAYAVDLAGNQSQVLEYDFSLNRFGSVFKAADDGTEDYIRRAFFHNSTERDLLIQEYNTNRLRKGSEKIELIRDGNTADRRTLVRGKEYDLQEDIRGGSTKGGRIYLYRIRRSVFEEEGDYSFSITSEDESGHINTTSRVYAGERGGDGKLSVSEFPIDFVVDKTPPVNGLAGVSSRVKQTFNGKSLVLGIYPEDAQTAVEKVEIRRWYTGTDLFGNPILPRKEEKPAEVRTYACYEEGEKPADKEGEYYEDLNQYVDPATDRIAIRCELEENRDWQVVEIIATDSAGNRSVDIREGSQEGTAEARRVFLITTDAYTRLVNNMGVRVGAGGVLVLAFLSAFLLRRRNTRSDC